MEAPNAEKTLDYATGPSVGNLFVSTGEGTVAITVRPARRHVVRYGVNVVVLLVGFAGVEALIEYADHASGGHLGNWNVQRLTFAGICCAMAVPIVARFWIALCSMHMDADRHRLHLYTRRLFGYRRQEWRADAIADVYTVLRPKAHPTEAIAVQLRTRDGLLNALGAGTREEAELIVRLLREALLLPDRGDAATNPPPPPAGAA